VLFRSESEDEERIQDRIDNFYENASNKKKTSNNKKTNKRKSTNNNSPTLVDNSVKSETPSQVKVLNEQAKELAKEDQEELPIPTDLSESGVNSENKQVDEIKGEKKNVENQYTYKGASNEQIEIPPVNETTCENSLKENNLRNSVSTSSSVKSFIHSSLSIEKAKFCAESNHYSNLEFLNEQELLTSKKQKNPVGCFSFKEFKQSIFGRKKK